MANSVFSALEIFKDIHQKHWELLPKGILKDLSLENYQKLVQVGLPDNKSEDWQYSDLSPMFDNFFNAPTLILKKSTSSVKFKSSYANNVLIENGKLKHAGVNSSVKVSVISEMNPLELNSIAKVIKNQCEKEKNPFALLNYSLLANGVSIKIAENAQIKLHIVSESDSSVFVSPFLFIESGKNSSLEIVYEEIRDQKAIAGVNSLLLVDVGENSFINISHLQLDGGNGYFLSQVRYNLNRCAKVSTQGIFAGSDLSRLDTKADLKAEGAEVNLHILNILKGLCQQHHFVRINHQVPNGSSTQLFKNILLDKCKVSVDGSVDVSKGAKQTNSQQLVNNLFLSDGARAFTKPNLRILNDDVKCKHGATSGSLEKENLFYLKSRGLSDDAARQLITRSFANEVLGQLKDQELLNYVLSRVFSS